MTRVAEGEDLVEAVGDEHQGAALVAQAAGDGEEPGDLVAAERGGRLVHDEQPCVERDGLGDLDDLLVGDREAERRAARVDVHAEPLEEGRRLAVHAPTWSMRRLPPTGIRPMKMFSVTERSGKSVGSW